MKVTDLGIIRLSSKQLGNYYLVGDKNHVTAYKILTYNGYNPDEIEFVGTTSNDNLSWDEAYDRIVGKPQKPDFTKVIA